MSAAAPHDDMRECHLRYLQQTMTLASQSPPKPTNFRVGCVIVAYPERNEPQVLGTGYTLELDGNTHAEQCALSKIARENGVEEKDLNHVFENKLNVTLYTSLEPCGHRLSGNLPCVQRIIATTEGNRKNGIQNVVFGAREPGIFVQNSQSCRLLTEAAVSWSYMPDFEAQILQIATQGHEKHGKGQTADMPTTSAHSANVTNIDDISDEERKRQAALPRNPKKRMMDTSWD